jgi:hypothetical protein
MNRFTHQKKNFLNSDIWEQVPEIAAGIVFVAILWGIGYMVSHHKNSIEKRYGFCTMTPDMKWIPCHVEPIMIRCMTPGGVFDKAGFIDRDILILPQVHSVSGFHRLLDKPKGTIVELRVIHYDNFKPDCDAKNWGISEERHIVSP